MNDLRNGVLGIEIDILYQQKVYLPINEMIYTPISDFSLKKIYYKPKKGNFMSRIIGQEELVNNIMRSSTPFGLRNYS